MPAPNLRAPKSIKGDTVTVLAQAAPTVVIENPAGSNKIFKVNSIFCANVSTSALPNISVSVYDGANDNPILSSVLLPIETTLVACTKESYFYIKESHSLRIQSSAADVVAVTVGFEEIE
jgi:hypothetical protein